MARLSGLASEHHPEGPGDGPKRRRGRNSKATASQASTGAEASSSSKRAASPTVQTTKRVKRVQVDDHDQLARELDESVSRSQASASVNGDAVSRRGRRFSEPPVLAQDEADGTSQATPPPATQPLPGLTPHLERLNGAPRRGRPAKSRMSLPAHLEAAEEHDNIVQFAPLTAIVNGRAQRRIRRNHLSEEINDIEDHNKQDARRNKEVAELHQQLDTYQSRVKELEFQLEASRLGNIAMADDDAQELQAELAETRRSMAELRASSVFAGSDDGFLDDDSHLMVDPEDLGIAEEDMEAEPLANGFYASQSLQTSTQYTSQVTLQTLDEVDETVVDTLADESQTSSGNLPDRISDQAVERYELEIKRLSRKVVDSSSLLRIIALQLQNLNILPAGASSVTIITELRHLLEDARDETESLFPNTTTGLDNNQLIRKILDLMRGTMVELREKVEAAQKYHAEAHLLRTQHDGLLDKLVDADEEKKTLQAKWHDVDRMLDEEKRNIVELQERLATMHQVAEEKDDTIANKDTEILGLKDELEDKEIGADRLRGAIETYKKDVDTLTMTLHNMEIAHAEEIAVLKQAHEEEVQQLQTELDAQTQAREDAEGEAQQKEEYIDQQETRIGQLQDQIEDTIQQISTLRERLENEVAARAAAETDRDTQTTLVYDHTNTIENLNETVADLQDQLNAMRQNLEAERTQREATEAELEQANGDIEDLNTRLHDAGLQANELRSKLFAVQQEKEATILKLTDEAAAREDELQDQLADETKLRTDTEAEVARLDKLYNDLENDLTATEDKLNSLTAAHEALITDRDSKVKELNRQIDDLTMRYTALETTSQTTIDSLRAAITDLTNERDDLRTKTLELEGAAVVAKVLHEAEIQERDNKLEVLEQEKEMLQKENESLARRVDSEAMELLNIVGDHAQEVARLQATIKAQDKCITGLEDEAEQRRVQYEEEITSKREELEDAQIIGATRAEHIANLAAQLEAMEKKYEIDMAASQETIETLQESHRVLVAQNEQHVLNNRRRQEEGTKAMHEMKSQGLRFRNKAVDISKVTKGKVTKVTEKQRITKKTAGRKKDFSRNFKDSGFVEDITVEDDEMERVVDEGVVN